MGLSPTCRQFLLLMWKGMILRKRHFLRTMFETVVPLAFLGIFVALRTQLSSFDDSWHASKNTTSFSPGPIEDFKIERQNSPTAMRTRFARDPDSYCVLYTPNTPLAGDFTYDALIDNIRIDPSCALIKGVDSETAMESEAQSIQERDNKAKVVGLVYTNLEGKGSLPSSLDYKIRTNTPGLNTDKKYPALTFSGPSNADQTYNNSGFLEIQYLVEHAFIRLQQNGTTSYQNLNLRMQKFYFPSYYDLTKLRLYLRFLSMIFAYGFLLMMSFFVRRIVDEKENRAKEMMRIMGLNDLVYFAGTFFNTFLLLIIILSLGTIFVKIPIEGGMSVINYTNGFLLWIIFLLFATNALLFCMAISTFFHKPVIAAIAAGVLWAMSYMPVDLMDPVGDDNKYMSFTVSQKLASCLLPTISIHWAFRVISFFEAKGEGSSWSNINEIPDGDNFNLGMILSVMAGSCLLYALIIWYVDNVWPLQHGIPKHPLYFLMPSYWCPKKSEESVQDESDNPLANKSYFEEEPANLKAGVSISHLTKAYGMGVSRKVAVNNLSLNMYHGQITALLGHNGAGKTTTMSVITGIFPPTAGSATVNGYSIGNQLKQARRSLALCPQHNVLYDTLTVEEHLLFFGGLKGLSWGAARKEIDECLSLLQLENKRNELAKNLSGGMKRKLSLGIAMIGGSEVLILDEPTSGMDPQARRAIWDLLTHIKQTRTIVLTTHYMEEADILGDRIAIMAEGVVQCCGSPLFLKRTFGAGYHLRVSKGEDFKDLEFREVVQRSVPSAYLDNVMKTEVSYILPVNDAQPFLTMFEDLEKEKDRLGYTACGLTITTMEDVFLKVGQISETGQGKPEDEENSLRSSQSTSDFGTFDAADGPSFQVLHQSRHSGFALWCSQVRGLLVKRWHDSRRYVLFLVFLILLPFVILTSMLTTKNTINGFVADSSLDKIQLDLGNVYGHTTSYYGTDTKQLVKYYEAVLKNAGATPVKVLNPLEKVLDIAEKDFTEYKQKLLVGADFHANGSDLTVTAMYNGEAYHTSPMALNLMDVAILRSVTGNDSATITLTNAPLKNTEDSNKKKETTGKLNNFLLGAFMPLAMSFLSASFVLFPVHERNTKSKLIQLMTGVDGLTFWSTHFVWDFTMHIIASSFVLIPFAMLDQVKAYAVGTGALGSLFFLLLMFGWCSIPLSYLFSFLAQKPAVGFTIAMAFNFISGMIMTIALSMTNVILAAMGKDTSWIESLVWVCRFLPNFSMAWGTMHIDGIAASNVFCDQMERENPEVLQYVCSQPNMSTTLTPCCPPDVCGIFCFKKRNMLGMDDDQCGRELLFMFISGCIFFAALALLESNIIRFWYRLKDRKNITPEKVSVPYLERQTSAVGEDSDVAKERSRVENLHDQNRTDEEAIVAYNLTKHFTNIVAVDHLTFAVHRDECFGLLGVNGAGKTTTFSMLTGDLTIGDGTAMIGHYSVREDLKQFQRQIGYCPQFDALLDRLTGREALFLFARLRGIHEGDIPRIVSSLINVVDLQKHADKIARKYSGGNRRKLSLALALIGSPPVVLLDEPTAGVDPASRRKIWNALVQVQQAGGTSLILTTHSMEECEALCGRLVIMVNGQFRCLGPIQYLKNKFGQGHTIIVKLCKDRHLDSQHTLAVQDFFGRTFPGCVLKDAHQGMLHYHIVDTSLTWSDLFREMEKAKVTFNLEDYLISDTTLEQIFLAFAKTQRVCKET